MRRSLDELAVAWLEAGRSFASSVPSRWTDLKEQIRRDPKILLQTHAARASLFGAGVAVVLVVFLGVVEGLAPGPGKGIVQPSRVGTFQVVCTGEQCGHRWVLTKPLDFDHWPVQCPACGQRAGYRLMRCPQPDCGRWVPGRVDVSGRRTCPHCGTRW
jgi:hypothetical protein